MELSLGLHDGNIFKRCVAVSAHSAHAVFLLLVVVPLFLCVTSTGLCVLRLIRDSIIDSLLIKSHQTRNSFCSLALSNRFALTGIIC